MLELIVSIFYLGLIAAVAYLYKSRQSSKVYRYFLPGLLFKVFAAIAFGLIYTFYYGYGDTFTYFASIEIFADYFGSSTINALKFYLGNHDLIFQEVLFTSNMFEIYFTGAGTISIIKIGLPLFYLGSQLFFPTTMLFALIPFFGQWKLFKALSHTYPKAQNYLAFGILFVPSVAFWGSGIMKDGVSLAGICYATGFAIEFFRTKKLRVFDLLFSLFFLFVVFHIKGYIVVAFIPALFFWIFYSVRSSIKNRALRVFVYPIILATATGFSVLFGLYIGEIDKRYSQQSALRQAQIIQENHYSEEGSEGTGSGYTLGEYNPTMSGIMLKFFPAVNVTLFRPYLWEVGNIVMLASALESLVALLLFVMIIWRVGIIKMSQYLTDDPFLVFCLVFTLLFSFIVGFSSFNFGALVRYKIPGVVFYFLLVLIPLAKKKVEKGNR